MTSKIAPKDISADIAVNDAAVVNDANTSNVARVAEAANITSDTNAKSLELLEQEVLQCHKCLLCETRNKAVFGVGNPYAEVMFIGEAPGKQEDLGGEPFVGSAGKLLNQMLQIAGIERKDIYIANVLKCRPPSNRNPRSQEIQECSEYLRGQVSAIAPDILVTLGNFATKFILKTDRGITSLRGRAYTSGRFYVLPTFHPAAAIYDKKKVEILKQDFELLKKLLEVERQRKAEFAVD